MSNTNEGTGTTPVLTLRVGSDFGEIPYILPLVRQLHRESHFKEIPFRYESYENMCRNVIEEPGKFGGFYVEADGEPAGFVYLFAQKYMGSDLQVATIHTFYIRPDLRGTPTGAAVWDRLKTAIRLWCIPRQCTSMMFHVQSGVDLDAIDAFMRMQGATHLGGNYIMRI